MRQKSRFFCQPLLGLVLLLSLLLALPVQAEEPVVRAVLFYSPSCGHCHKVITEDFPPLFEKYGDQLQIIGIDTSQEGASAFYVAAVEKFGSGQTGVPLLVIGDQILYGSLEIPEKLPGLIEKYMAEGGVDWPEIPGLAEAINASEQAAPPTEQSSAPTAETSIATPEQASPQPEPTETPAAASFVLPDEPGNAALSVSEKLALDPAGNGLAIIVLSGMLVSTGYLAATFKKSGPVLLPRWENWLFPALCLVGLGVAGYLAYVETAHVSAVCGPVGDCNTVQQSEYARLFGVLPIGVLGVAGYVALLVAWFTTRFTSGRIQDTARLAILGMSLFGVLFSIYLTFLEPFVIGATCAWCLTSAILMTILLWLSIAPAKQALNRLTN